MINLLDDEIPSRSTWQASWYALKAYITLDGRALYRVARRPDWRKVVIIFAVISAAITSLSTFVSGIPQMAGFEYIRLFILAIILIPALLILFFFTRRNNTQYLILLIFISSIFSSASTFASIITIGSPHEFARDYNLAVAGIRLEPELRGQMCELPSLIVQRQELVLARNEAFRSGNRSRIAAQSDLVEVQILLSRGTESLQQHEEQRIVWLNDSIQANMGIARANADVVHNHQLTIDRIDARQIQIVDQFENRYNRVDGIALWSNVTAVILIVMFFGSVINSYNRRYIRVIIGLFMGVSIGVAILIGLFVMTINIRYPKLEMGDAIIVFATNDMIGGSRICTLQH